MPMNAEIGRFDMSRTVVPILTFDDNRNPTAFLGTGFFVGQEPLLITAGHNVRGVAGQLGIMLVTDMGHYYAANVLHIDEERDVALLEVAGYRPERRFAFIPDDIILQNETVLCLEYGTTRQQGGHIFLSVATRMGNVTRQIAEMNLLGRNMTNLLEVSFPALRGASGAPILTSQGFLVIGMLVANASYHLLPVQIEQVLGQEGELLEQVQFMMPQGIAVHASLIKEALDQAGEPRNPEA